MDFIIYVLFLISFVVFLLSMLGLIFPSIYKRKFGGSESIRKEILLKRFIPSFFLMIFLSSMLPKPESGKAVLSEKEASDNVQSPSREIHDGLRRIEEEIKDYFGDRLVSISHNDWLPPNAPHGKVINVVFRARDNFPSLIRKGIELDISKAILIAYCDNNEPSLKNLFFISKYGDMVVYKVNMTSDQAKRINCNDRGSYQELEVIPKLWETQYIKRGL